MDNERQPRRSRSRSRSPSKDMAQRASKRSRSKSRSPSQDMGQRSRSRGRSRSRSPSQEMEQPIERAQDAEIPKINDELPTDIINQVLSRLQDKQSRDAAMLTCRPWREYIRNTRDKLRFVPPHLDPNLPRFGRVWHDLPEQLLKAVTAMPKVQHIFIRIPRGSDRVEVPPSLYTQFPAQRLAKLTCLTMTGLHEIEQGLIVRISESCHELSYLDMGTCSGVSNDTLRALGAGCRKLAFLKIWGTQPGDVSDEGIQALLSGCRSMKTLVMKGDIVPNVKGWGFESGAALTRLQIDEGCTGLTSQSFTQGLSGTPLLHTLSLRWIETVEDLDLGTAISQLGPSLQVLRLAYARWGFTDTHLWLIAHACPNLRVLHASYCYRVHLHGWQALAQRSLKLEELDVGQCEGFCDNSLLAIAQGCPSLRSLKLSASFSPPHPAFLTFQAARPTVQVEFWPRYEN